LQFIKIATFKIFVELFDSIALYP